MRLYDSEPRQYSDNPMSWFDSDGMNIDDPTIFTNFNDARKAAISKLEEEIHERQMKLNKLSKILKAADCPEGPNPFNSY